VPCVLTIFFVFIFFKHVSYTFAKYSDFCENENICYNSNMTNETEYSGNNCCAECTCIHPHKSTPVE